MMEPANGLPTYGVFERDLLPERIATRLVSLIAESQLRPGDKLPPERDLAAAMRVSRASLREALRALAMLKIVEVRHGSGTYVASLKPELLVEHFDFVFPLDDATFAELLEARRMLEPALAAAAAERATAAEREQLAECGRRAAQHASDPDGFLEADLELHRLITAAAHNQIIARFMAGLTRLGQASRRRTAALPGVMEQSVQDHQAIVAAVVRGDPAAAAETMRRHLGHIQDSLAESTGQLNPLVNTSGEEDGTDNHLG